MPQFVAPPEQGELMACLAAVIASRPRTCGGWDYSIGWPTPDDDQD